MIMFSLAFISKYTFATNASDVADDQATGNNQDLEDDVNGSNTVDSPADFQSWLNNNLGAFFSDMGTGIYKVGVNLVNLPTTVSNNIAQTGLDIYNAPIVTNIRNIIGSTPIKAPAPTTTSTPAPVTAPAPASEPIITIVTQDKNVTSMPGGDFTRLVIKPSVNKSRDAINSDTNIRNINLKLNSLYMSNGALSQ
jgi:hypothetical protein